jgi:hypothetical protein
MVTALMVAGSMPNSLRLCASQSRSGQCRSGVDALAGCLDQVGQPVLAPEAGTGLNRVVNQAGESHTQPLSKPTSALVVDFRPPFDSLKVG